MDDFRCLTGPDRVAALEARIRQIEADEFDMLLEVEENKAVADLAPAEEVEAAIEEQELGIERCRARRGALYALLDALA